MFRKKSAADSADPASDHAAYVTEGGDLEILEEEEPVVNLGTSSAGLPLNEIHSRSMKLLGDALSPGEEVICRLAGMSKSQSLVLTDRRAFIIKVGWRSGQTLGGKVSSFEYRNINSVEVRASMMTGVFEIAAGGVQGREAAYFGKDKSSAWKLPNTLPIAKKQMKDFQLGAQAIRERSSTAQHPAAVVAAPAPPDVMDQIRKLGTLHAEGVLSEEEFASKKAELLARM
jgi:hypothetical protein